MGDAVRGAGEYWRHGEQGPGPEQQVAPELEVGYGTVEDLADTAEGHFDFAFNEDGEGIRGGEEARRYNDGSDRGGDDAEHARERLADRGHDGGSDVGAGAGPRLAADHVLAQMRDAASVAVAELEERAEQIRADAAAGLSSDEAAEELSWIEDAVPQIVAWADALGAARGGAPLRQDLAAYIVLMGRTISREAQRQRRAHPENPLWGMFWTKVEKKLPRLAPSLAAKTHVREWTLGWKRASRHVRLRHSPGCIGAQGGPPLTTSAFGQASVTVHRQPPRAPAAALRIGISSGAARPGLITAKAFRPRGLRLPRPPISPFLPYSTVLLSGWPDATVTSATLPPRAGHDHSAGWKQGAENVTND